MKLFQVVRIRDGYWNPRRQPSGGTAGRLESRGLSVRQLGVQRTLVRTATTSVLAAIDEAAAAWLRLGGCLRRCEA
jgi:hypothetical protein